MAISLIDARSTSLTVSWPSVEGATRYILEYRTVSDAGDDDDNEGFTLLSDKLTQTQARKRNLSPSTSYFFRVAAAYDADDKKDWVSHEQALTTLSADDDALAMEAPKVTHPGSNQALLVSWTSSKNNGSADSKYELQMRENAGGAEWTTIAPSFSGTQVKKKNLTSKQGYLFRVRPSTGDDDNATPFSSPSDAVVARGLSVGIQRFFNSLDDGTLLQSNGSAKKPVPLADALGGKEFVLLYASAHWCPPCRQFTPMLANFYKTVRTNVEIVFLSCDHDEKGFQGYFATHPWIAVDFEDDARENLLAAIRVSGIPRLVVLSGRTGKIIEDNAVGKPLDLQRWRALDK